MAFVLFTLVSDTLALNNSLVAMPVKNVIKSCFDFIILMAGSNQVAMGHHKLSLNLMPASYYSIWVFLVPYLKVTYLMINQNIRMAIG